MKISSEARVIDASGKFMIPGLWDMHVHWYDAGDSSSDYLPLFLANGVTGVRQMRCVPMHHEWRRSIKNGTLLGPRMAIASEVLEGAPPVWPDSLVVRNEMEARDAVRKSKAEGADFIKVYSSLSREAFFAIADESKKQGVPFVGHVPSSVTPAEVSDAGQKSIEHLTEIVLSSLRREEEFREEVRRSQATGAPPPWLDPAKIGLTIRIINDGFSPERADALFRTFKRNHTWEVPTLTVNRNTAFLDIPSLQNDPNLNYLSGRLRAEWNAAADRSKKRTLEAITLERSLYQKKTELVGMMSRAGVDLLAGTDVGNPYCMPGFSLHDELRLLVQAGLTPAQALRTATINPARFLDEEQDLGTVSTGKNADLVLLDANPLQDIRNTTRINAVVVNGRLLDRTALDKMLNQVKAIASNRGNVK